LAVGGFLAPELEEVEVLPLGGGGLVGRRASGTFTFLELITHHFQKIKNLILLPRVY